MRTLHYELCALIDNSFFESKKPSVDTDVPACSQHQTSYVENVRFWQMSNLWVFCGFSTRNDGFVKVGDVLFDEVYVLFYFCRFFVLIKGKFFLSLTTWHDNRHPVNTETLYGPSSARINGALLCLHQVCTIWLLSHSSLGRRIGRGRGREWRSENIVWPKFAFLVGKTVPYVLGAIPTSFPGFSFKS